MHRTSFLGSLLPYQSSSTQLSYITYSLHSLEFFHQLLEPLIASFTIWDHHLLGNIIIFKHIQFSANYFLNYANCYYKLSHLVNNYCPLVFYLFFFFFYFLLKTIVFFLNMFQFSQKRLFSIHCSRYIAVDIRV